MTNLNPTPGWDAVPQLETTTQALGGPGGPMNSQAQALLNRTEWLKGNDDAVLAGAKSYADNGDTATLQAANAHADAAAGAATPADGSVTDAKLAQTSAAYIITQNAWTLKRFGAKGDGVTDDTQAIIAAFSSGEKYIEGDAGTFAISGAIPVSSDGFSFQGKGQFQTIFQSHDAAAPGIQIASGLTGVKVGGFQIAKAMGQVSAGDAVTVLGTSQNCELFDILAIGFYQGFVVGTTDWGVMRLCTASKNWSNGFRFSNVSTYAPVQWQVDGIFAGQNNGHGVYVQSTPGPGQPLVLGAWHNVQTYANNGFALILEGSSDCAINDLRLSQFFFGNDAAGEVYIDAFGTNNRIENGMIEEASKGRSGPTLGTQNPGTGSSVHVGPNEVDFSVSNTTITQSAMSGIDVYGGDVNIANVNINYAGAISPTGTAAVSVVNGVAIITGGRFRNNPYGFSVSSTGAIVASGCDLNGNTNGPTYGVTSTSKITGCLPLTANN
jgi:hypothetical protein